MEPKAILRLVGNCNIGQDWKTTVERSENRLYYVKGGNGGYIKNGEKIPFETGKIYLLPAFAETETYTDNFFDHLYVNFELIPPIISNDVLRLEINSDPIVCNAASIFTELCKIGKTSLSTEELALLSSTVMFLSFKAASTEGAMILDDPIINCALHIMHSDLTVSVKELAKLCYMSSDGFIRRFKRYIGKTPYEYLKLLKLRTAEEYRKQGATLSEVAEVCGYSDASSLLHAMKKKH